MRLIIGVIPLTPCFIYMYTDLSLTTPLKLYALMISWGITPIINRIESDVPKSPHHRTSSPPPSPPSTPPNRSSSPPRWTQPSPSPRRNQGNYANSIESQLTDSLRALELEPGVTRREVNVRYRFLARRLHPDEYDPEITGMTPEEAGELFKRLNNAQQFIRDSM